MKKIIIDLLGSDSGQEELLKGVVNADKNYAYVLVGDKKKCDEALYKSGINYVVEDCSSFVANGENPIKVVRDGGVSLARCFALLKDPDAVGLLTAGSTGAALVGTAFSYGLIKGLMSPLLCCNLIKADMTEVCVADCGANLSPSAEDMVKYSVLASAFISAYKGIDDPKVYLLNVGKEGGKGTETLKKAYSLLSEAPIDFCGNIEADAVFTSDADVVVCDGVTGNVFLKGCESVAACIKGIISSVCPDGELVKKLNSRIDDSFAYNDKAGAIFLGADKPIVKLHGKANPLTVKSGIDQIINAEKGGFFDKFNKIKL